MFATSKYTPFTTLSIATGNFYNSKSGYSFRFNGQESDNEIAGTGNIMTAEFWEYDTRLGRRWNVDPKPQINLSDYSVMGDNPILFIDRLGDAKQSRHLDGDGKVIAEYNDGDNSVYKHQTAKTKQEVDYWRNKFKNNSGNGVKVGTMSRGGLGVFNLNTFNPIPKQLNTSNYNRQIRKNEEFMGGGPDAAGAGFGLDFNGRNAQFGGAIQFIETERGNEKFVTYKGGFQNGYNASISGGPFIDLYWKSKEGSQYLVSDMLLGESNYVSAGFGLMVTYSWVENNTKTTVLRGLNFTLGFGFSAGKQHTEVIK